jgi:antirestriction protein ArdC
MTDEQEIRCRRFYYSLRDIPEVVISARHERSQYDEEKDQILLPIEDKELQFLWAKVYHELGHRQFCRYQDRLTFEIPSHESEAYEKVVAETTGAFLCKQAGIYDITCQSHCEHISLWKITVSNKALLKEVIPAVIGIIEELLCRKIDIEDIPDEILGLFLEDSPTL